MPQQLPIEQFVEFRLMPPDVVWGEMMRARRSEKEKDATIKALADALIAESHHVVAGRPCWCTPTLESALRLAGRLP